MKYAPLSPHERHALMLAACGMCNREIAARLGVTPNGAAATMHQIYGKLGLCRRQSYRWRRHRAIYMFFIGEAL